MWGRIADFAAKRKMRAALKARQAHQPSWEKLERIAVLIDDHCKSSKHELDKFIAQTGKYVEVFFIRSNDKAPAYSDWTCISKKDFGFFKLPRKEFLQGMKRRSFDLVIDASEKNSRFSAMLAASMPAGLRCSYSSYYPHAELVITRDNVPDMVAYLGEVIRYVERITVRRQ